MGSGLGQEKRGGPARWAVVLDAGVERLSGDRVEGHAMIESAFRGLTANCDDPSAGVEVVELGLSQLVESVAVAEDQGPGEIGARSDLLSRRGASS